MNFLGGHVEVFLTSPHGERDSCVSQGKKTFTLFGDARLQRTEKNEYGACETSARIDLLHVK